MCVLFPDNYSERHAGCSGESYCRRESASGSEREIPDRVQWASAPAKGLDLASCTPETKSVGCGVDIPEDWQGNSTDQFTLIYRAPEYIIDVTDAVTCGRHAPIKSAAVVQYHRTSHTSQSGIDWSGRTIFVFHPNVSWRYDM
jgi:hypothetical protein